MILYGIKNCDTVKKARRWLDSHDIDYTFHDVRSDGINKATIESWLETVSWDSVLNKRGTTWRKLDDPRKETLNQAVAIELMLEHPTLIKRPVLTRNEDCMVGFKDDDYKTYFGK
jgi:arsenate reductase